jgi:hypothetical protein
MSNPRIQRVVAVDGFLHTITIASRDHDPSAFKCDVDRAPVEKPSAVTRTAFMWTLHDWPYDEESVDDLARQMAGVIEKAIRREADREPRPSSTGE